MNTTSTAPFELRGLVRDCVERMFGGGFQWSMRCLDDGGVLLTSSDPAAGVYVEVPIALDRLNWKDQVASAFESLVKGVEWQKAHPDEKWARVPLAA